MPVALVRRHVGQLGGHVHLGGGESAPVLATLLLPRLNDSYFRTEERPMRTGVVTKGRRGSAFSALFTPSTIPHRELMRSGPSTET